jgi:hypothetical protein
MIVECKFPEKNINKTCLGGNHGAKCPHYEPHEYDGKYCLSNKDITYPYYTGSCICERNFKCIMLEAINKK